MVSIVHEVLLKVQMRNPNIFWEIIGKFWSQCVQTTECVSGKELPMKVGSKKYQVLQPLCFFICAN